MMRVRRTGIWFVARQELYITLKSPLLYLSCIWLAIWTYIKTNENYLNVWEKMVFGYGDAFIVGIALCPSIILISSLSCDISQDRQIVFRIGKAGALLAQAASGAVCIAILLLYHFVVMWILSLLQGSEMRNFWGDWVVTTVTRMNQASITLLPLFPITPKMLSDILPINVVIISICLDFFLLFLYWMIGYLLSSNSKRKTIGQVMVLVLHLLSYHAIQNITEIGKILPLGNFLCCYLAPWSIYRYSTLLQTIYVSLTWIGVSMAYYFLFRFEVTVYKIKRRR